MDKAGYSNAKKTITLRPQALAFFRKNQVALLSKVFEGWAHFLTKVNAPKRLTTLVQNHRGWQSTLAEEGKPIRGTGPVLCFACGIYTKYHKIRSYPLMPWSYVFESEMWPHVPLCYKCRDIAWDQNAGQEMIGRLIKTSHKFSPPTEQ